jgi:hypothetical protein
LHTFKVETLVQSLIRQFPIRLWDSCTHYVHSTIRDKRGSIIYNNLFIVLQWHNVSTSTLHEVWSVLF